jgi:membrane-bound metal-dependent hydrolase YbcI (DUF457 family)
MPDWLTHILLGLILVKIFNVKKKSLVLLGTILPDILPKLILLRLFIPLPEISSAVLKSFHTPFILFLFTLLIAPLFKYNYQKVVFWFNLGIMSHFLADLTLRHLHSNSGLRLLYPLTLQKFNLGWVWPEQSYLIAIPALLIYLIIIFLKKKKISSKDIMKPNNLYIPKKKHNL